MRHSPETFAIVGRRIPLRLSMERLGWPTSWAALSEKLGLSARIRTGRRTLTGRENDSMTHAGCEIRETFERDGYLILPHLFSAEETDRLKAEIQSVVEEVRLEKERKGEDWQSMMRVGVHVGVAFRSPFYKEAVADARILDVLEQILGPDIEFLSDKAVFKDHEADFGSPWHQDHPYWQGSHKISLWVALDDATEDNGCLKLVPGSHKGQVAHADAKDGLGFGHRLADQDEVEARAVSAPIEAGGAIFFHDLTLHASHPNTAGADRWVWIPSYRSLHHQDPQYEWAVAARPVRRAGESSPAN